VLLESSYRPPRYLLGADLQTISTRLRRMEAVAYRRERLELADGDFVDLDWSQQYSRRLVIIAHGMEGHSRRPYVLGMAHAFKNAGWDALAWNMRSCSGESNRLPGFYHAGMTADLAAIVDRVCASAQYDSIALVGFSLGGNLILKYLGEAGAGLAGEVKAAATFSVPCDLAQSAVEIHRWRNRFYLRRFMRHLRAKVKNKAAAMPGLIDASGIDDIKDLYAFDERYTAPMHGYASAEEYWRLNSCRRYLPSIRVPALIANAENDTFLGGACYPQGGDLSHVYWEVPAEGGHVGFPLRHSRCWMEERAREFVEGF
jgi:predicted alpha/beta-fold hydrolase